MQKLIEFLAPAARSELAPADERERYVGTLLGLAVGNALGLGVEGLSASEIRASLPDGVRDIASLDAKRPWDDDTAQAIELGECLLADRFDPNDFLQRLLRWADENGRGMGRQTYQVLMSAKAGAPGTTAAWAVWEKSGREAAGNGGVMRCAPVALRWRREPGRLIEDARLSTMVTHYDPRCQWSSVVISAVLAHALAASDWNADALADALSETSDRDSEDAVPREVIEAARLSSKNNLGAFEPDEPLSMGYTIRTMGIGLWAARQETDLETILLEVINAGGDTDTNGAVAGALLGARFGATAIPERWLESLYDRPSLESLAMRLLDISGRLN